ncbi:MAG: VOC family protein [Pseudomonas sp.]
MSATYPRSFSHIGLSVTDLDAAVAFYTDVLGWYLIMPPTTISEDGSAIGVMCTDVFGAGWGSFRIAHLSTGDRVGVEIFQFPNAQRPENNFEYWKTGVFHFCVQDPDVEGLAARIVAAGGKQRMPVREYFPGETVPHGLHGRPLRQHPRDLQPQLRADLLGRGLPMNPETSRAWTWQGAAEPSALRLETRQLPTPASGEVLVRNAVIGLNPVDWKVLGGELVDWQPGKVPGVDGAGTVVALGAGVDPRWLGRRVAYHQDLGKPGSFAEHTPVATAVLLRVPEALDFETAASFPCPALTAWQALEKLPLRSADRLLVSGAGGAVGHYLVQLAAERDVQVSAMCHPRHWQRLQEFGAVECLPGPLPDGELWQDGARFHALIDCVGSAHAERLAPSLRANGHLLCIQGRLADWPNPPFGLALSLHEVALGALHRFGDAQDWARLVEAGEGLLKAIAAGQLRSEPLVIGEFEALPEHLEALKHRSFSGKPLIRI